MDPGWQHEDVNEVFGHVEYFKLVLVEHHLFRQEVPVLTGRKIASQEHIDRSLGMRNQVQCFIAV